MLTRTSVHCADRIVATASSNGVVKSSSQYTCGKATASSRFIRRARRTNPRCDSSFRAPPERGFFRCSELPVGVVCTQTTVRIRHEWRLRRVDSETFDVFTSPYARTRSNSLSATADALCPGDGTSRRAIASALGSRARSRRLPRSGKSRRCRPPGKRWVSPCFRPLPPEAEGPSVGGSRERQPGRNPDTTGKLTAIQSSHRSGFRKNFRLLRGINHSSRAIGT